MDPMRPVSVRQAGGSTTPTSNTPSSLMNSPFNRHIRSGSTGNMRKPQHTKAAAQRLAQVMAHQMTDDEDNEDDLLYEYNPSSLSAGVGLASSRPSRTRSPMVNSDCVSAFGCLHIYTFCLARNVSKDLQFTKNMHVNFS